MRFFISMLQEEPFSYIVTKIKNTAPKGIVTVTVKQDEFNQFADYVNLETGDMVADYYKSNIVPSDGNDSITDVPPELSMSLSVKSYNACIGSSKRVKAHIINAAGEEIDYSDDLKWEFYFGEENVTEDNTVIASMSQDLNELIFEYADDDYYVNNILTLKCTYGEISSSIEFNVSY